MNKSVRQEEVFAKTNRFSPALIVAAFDRAFTNLSSDFLAQHILKNDETFEKLIKIIFEMDKLFHKMEDRFIQGLQISEADIMINNKPVVLRQYFYMRMNRRINVASFKFTTDSENERLYIKQLSNLDYKCELLASIQK